MVISVYPTDPNTHSPKKKVNVIATDNDNTTDADNEHRKQQCLADLIDTCERKHGLLLNELKIPHESTDHLCRRYLTTHGWDADEAIAHITQTIAWRKKEQISVLLGQKPDDILGCSEVDVLSQMPMWWMKRQLVEEAGCHGSSAGIGDSVQRDRAGRPVFCYDIGGLDVKGLVKTTDIGSFLRYVIWRMEQTMKMLGESHHRGVDKFVMVIDLKGLGLFRHVNRNVIEIVRTLSMLGAKHYPETLHIMFFVNTPKLFKGVWATIRQLINSQTRAKVAMAGIGDASSTALLVHMEQDVVDSVLRLR